MRFRAVVAYDGSGFRGWAAQPGLPTVQGTLEGALRHVVGTDVVLTVAGRTDAGVHAWGQVISGDVPEATDLDALRGSLNGLCGPSVAVRSLERSEDGFSARFDAVARTYRYRLGTTTWRDPFTAPYVWWVGHDLDVAVMAEAAAVLVGEHDFASFCKATSAGGTTRRLTSVDVVRFDDGAVDVWLEASAFCHQMVRSIVGLVEAVGSGRRPPASVADVLGARDRSSNPTVAPPHGLTLWHVTYT